MKQYHDLLIDILANGVNVPDRTGVGTRAVFGRQLRFNLRDGFPLMTTKRIYWRGVVHELLWMLDGDQNIGYLNENGVHIWDAHADAEGDVGPIYGPQWRGVQGTRVDQLAALLGGLRTDPFSRRHVVSARNPDLLPAPGVSPQMNAAQGRMALAPCHCLFQFNVQPIPEGLQSDGGPRGLLSCQLYQRSADAFLGVPFNIASYALLTCMVAQQVGMVPHEFIHTFGDVHLYRNHIHPDIVYEQLNRQPGTLPALKILRKPESLFDYQFNDFDLIGYAPEGAIKAPLAV